MKTKNWLLLALFICLGLGLRLINFGSNPTSLYWDEIAIGLDARSLIETGKDINGNSWLQPLFKSYGDYKAPVYILATTLLSRFFGITEVIIRLPSLIAFAILSLSLFFLTKEIFPSKKLLPWISLLNLSFLPWSYHFSRIGMESHLSLLFLTASIYLLIKGLKGKKATLTILSALVLSLGIYSYIALRVIGPILFFITFILYKPKNNQFFLKTLATSLIIITVSTLILTTSSFYKQSQNYRLSNNNLLTSNTHITKSIAARKSTDHSLISRVAYHRYYYKAKEYLSNYFEYFSPNFLFFKGDPNLRHHSGYGGELLLIQGAFLIIGLLSLSSQKNKPKILILSWALLSPSIAALVNETPHASRAIYLMIPLVVFISLGMNQLLQIIKPKNKLLYIPVFLTIFINFFLYLYDYHQYYPKRSSLAWIYPYTKIFKYFANHPTPKQVFVTSEFYQPELYAKFYLKNYDNFSFDLPETCPKDALCVTKDNWELITKPTL